MPTAVTSKSLLRKLLPIIFLCFCLPLFTSCESNRTIVNGLDEKEANEILVFLSNNGIQASKVQSEEGGGTGGQKQVLWNISVNNDNATEAMALLNQSGLPRRRGQNLLNIFSNVGLVPTDMQEKIRYQAGLAEQIASTIRKIDGVLDAEVQISFPEEDPLNPGKKKGDITASVYVKHSGVLDDPNTHLATKIRRLVTGSITGLKYDNVTLILDRARFRDAPTGNIAGNEESKQYVNIWSLVIGKESVTRFRIIFFTFVILILLIILAIVWIGWKIHPLIESHGGLRQLLTLKPLGENNHAKQDKKQAEKPKEDKKQASSTAKTQQDVSDAEVDADIDADFEEELDEEDKL